MKKYMYAVSVALMLLAAPAFAETVNVKVSGLVCDFCAQSLKKTFGKQSSVNDISINLDDGLVRIGLKDGAALDDETIKKLVTDSGYTITGIERTK